ncbi:MAG: YggT family protein [Nitrospirae bacterium]|nr:YggT family protein [Nitrospirota bacterium]
MFIAANLITAVAEVISLILYFYMWVIIIRALVSWVNPDPYNPIVQFLYKVTEPVLHPIRRLMPVYNMGIDLSPLIVILSRAALPVQARGVGASEDVFVVHPHGPPHTIRRGME